MPTYASWSSMRRRSKDIDPRWDSYETFRADMGERPPGALLIRRNVKAPFGLNNCQWGTWKQQGVLVALRSGRRW